MTAPAPVQRTQVRPHGLNGAGFADDAALARALHTWPADLMDINHYTYDAEGRVRLRTGERGNQSGEALLAAIQQGKLWVNLRGVERGWPKLWRAAMAELGEAAREAGVKPLARVSHLILSSPAARVPYHFDAAGVMLFHLRGRKRIFVYPGEEAFLPETAMEQVVTRQTTEEVPYRPSFDGDAEVVDLEPGQRLAWPFYAPHRVENLDLFCVSLSVEYQTWPTRLRNGALYTNAVLRRFGLRPKPTRTMGEGEMAARWAASVMLKRLGVLREKLSTLPRDFVPDAKAVDGMGAR